MDVRSAKITPGTSPRLDPPDNGVQSVGMRGRFIHAFFEVV